VADVLETARQVVLALALLAGAAHAFEELAQTHRPPPAAKLGPVLE
jgi:hypothetical protein